MTAADGFRTQVRGYLDELRAVVDNVDAAELAAVLDALWTAWEDDRTAFIVGNGGSASTASHMACDLAKQTQIPGRRPLRAHSLTDNVALMSALANDSDWTQVFSEQLRIHARPGDLLVCISASGNSHNVLRAISEARSSGLRVIGFGGFDGGRMREACDLYVHAPSYDYGHVETTHLLFDHVLTALLFEFGKMTAGSRPAVLVDRDGVVIRNRDDYVRDWSQVEILPGAIEALAALSRSGHRVLIVTNQSVIGRGLATRETVDRIHERLAAMVAQHGGRIDAFLVCPHAPDAGCDCRKPKPGLLFRARDDHSVDLARAWLIGDHADDITAATAAGVRSILVMTGRTTNPNPIPATSVAKDLTEAANQIQIGMAIQ